MVSPAGKAAWCARAFAPYLCDIMVRPALADPKLGGKSGWDGALRLISASSAGAVGSLQKDFIRGNRGKAGPSLRNSL